MVSGLIKFRKIKFHNLIKKMYGTPEYCFGKISNGQYFCYRELEEQEGIEAARKRKLEEDKAEEERKKRERIDQMRKAAQMRREAVSKHIIAF